MSGTRGVAGAVNTTILKRSSVNSGGTSSTLTNVQHDSVDSPALAIVNAYTANPATLGTLVGNIRAVAVFLPTAALNSSSNEYVYNFDSINIKSLILRSGNEVICVSFGGATVAGSSLNFWIVWTEE
jgi:hypothetical protein